MKKSVVVLFIFSLNLMPVHYALAERIKDVASIGGVRTNQLVGYGLVVGLDGSGDQTAQTPFTVQSMLMMLSRLGIEVPPNVNPQLTNVAAVMVHANLPAFSKPGQMIDVTVSSIGNAASLRGGSLLMTEMKGVDGNIYAVAQGNLVVSGFGVQGEDGSSVTVNIPSTGRIPNGATVEREVLTAFTNGEPRLVLNLNSPDFTTARNLTEMINQVFGPGTANALDGASVEVISPSETSTKVAFVSVLENLQVETGDAPAKVIINSRTGTVVIGSHVKVEEAAVSHGSLIVSIAEINTASQPGPFAGGDTTVVNNSIVSVEEENSRMFLFQPGVSLDDLVRAVNQVGASPSDLVAILEALQQVGALRAQLIVI